MVEGKANRGNEQRSEELFGVKVYFSEGRLSGLETADGRKTEVNYKTNKRGYVEYKDGAAVIDEVKLADGSKLKLDPSSGDYLDVHGHALYTPPVVHLSSMGDNQAFIRYSDSMGNARTVFASRDDVMGPCLPTDRGLLMELWEKNLPRVDSNGNREVSLAELVKAVEDPLIKDMDAVFIATLKRRFDIICDFDKELAISRKDMDVLARQFQRYDVAYTGRHRGSFKDLDCILNSWVNFQNKAQFVTSKLYLHGSDKSIRPEYVLQGDTGNCYFQSAVMALAKANPKLIESMISSGPDGSWKVLFPQKRYYGESIIVKPLTESEQLLYSGASGGGQWSGVLEKAWGQHREKYLDQLHHTPKTEMQTIQDFCDGGEQKQVMDALTDRVCAAPPDNSLEKLHEVLTLLAEKNMPMGAGMKKSKVKGLHGNHNYAILDYDPKERLVTLYDPNHYFESQAKKGRDRDGVKDGISKISLEEFQASCDEFNYLDRPYADRTWTVPPKMNTELFVDSNIVKTNGEVVMATQDEAIALCKELGGHLPTARECAEYMNREGILEADFVDKELNGKAPDGYYKVECMNEGKLDVFYFNNNLSRELFGEIAKLSFWTSSKVVGNPKYGHVFYGWLGGGRQSKDDHEGSYKHAVLIVRDAKTQP